MTNQFYFSEDDYETRDELKKILNYYEKAFSKHDGEFNNSNPFFLTVDSMGKRVEFHIPEVKFFLFEDSKKYGNLSYIYFDEDEIRYRISFPNEIIGSENDNYKYDDILDGLEKINLSLDLYKDFVSECLSVFE